ncbi:CCAAT/enhancer-binding protein zeta-like [Salvia splendens]|uniref:CCAAT/enhancer-binding protein zeta-like n=1 Tax=Salvia splendens TaxID=180675 RepID=UPI001C272166|nr:CCAAT/enhancer-binding protein zeta-like [Salvia splendens]
MVAVKKNKPPKDAAVDLNSDVAAFASTLGFSSSAPSSGFNDSDFRKTGSFKTASQSPKSAAKNPKSNPKQHPKPAQNQKRDFRNSNSQEKHVNSKLGNPKPNPKQYPKPAQNQKRDFRSNNSQGNHAGGRFNNPRPVQNEKVDFMSSNLPEENAVDSKFKNLPKLPLVKSSLAGVWHSDLAELEEKLIGNDKKIEFKDAEEWKGLVEKKKELGERLLAQYAQEYMTSRGQHGDIKMLFATQRSGTAADKVSALSVLIGDNAVANLRAVDTLLGMVTSKVGKRHAFTAFEALKEMFLILLPDRKLKTLSQRPLNHLSDTKDGYSLLLFWYWEQSLKERYEQFVSALQEASLDVIVRLKSMALKIIYTLLKNKSEQERKLLSALVNKLGDPENKVASNADYHLANLLSEHPNMKAVVIDEVDTFLFRPRLGLRSKYHAVNFLTQIRLSHKGDGPKAAKRLIDIYFTLFKLLISEASTAQSEEKKDKKNSSSSKEGKSKALSESHIEMDSRLLSALLTGVNRAFPFVSTEEADDVIEVQTPLLFQLVHSKNFNVGVQALMLLDKISSKNQIVSDRFYRALYSKLLLPAAMNSSKEEMFIALLLRAMKNDINIKRVCAFSKRLLQVALQLPPQYACGCLFLLSEVLKARPPLWNMVLQNEVVDADDDLEHFEDITENDGDQAIPASDNSNKKGQIAETSQASDDDSEESLLEGATSDSDEDGQNEADDLFGGGGFKKTVKSKLESTGDLEVCSNQAPTPPPGGYNPRHREPAYCNADRAAWRELTVFASHGHPSVAAMAKTLLSGVNIVYNGNPIGDLSLGAFLDKFMEKKPKQNTWHGASDIEPAKKIDMNHQLIGPEILSLAEADVPPEDVVFHKFYMNKKDSSKKLKKKMKKKKTAEDEAAEEIYAVASDEDESDNEEIENVLDASNRSQADSDHDYDDLDNEDDEDLIAEGSDGEIDIPTDDEVSDDGGASLDEDSDDDDIAEGQADDGSDFDEDEAALGEGGFGDDSDSGSDLHEGFEQGRKKKKTKTKKRKSSKGPGASPFASLEEYEHLMEEESLEPSAPKEKKHKSKMDKKKRKLS